MHKYN